MVQLIYKTKHCLCRQYKKSDRFRASDLKSADICSVSVPRHDYQQAIGWHRLPDAPQPLVELSQYGIQLPSISLCYLSLPGQLLFRRQGFLVSCLLACLALRSRVRQPF